MRLNPSSFNAHLYHMGQKVRWRKSFACPCINPHSGASKPNCPLCGGKGRLWDPAVDTVIGIASQNVQKMWAQMGQWEAGDAVVSIPEASAMYNAAQFDRVLMMNSTDGFSLVLTRGAANERLHEPIEKIERVFWLDAQSNIVEGRIPSVADNGALTWASGAPPAGTQYTISGTRYSEYFVFNQLPSDRGEHQGARLPKRVVLRRFDLFNR
jgi:hypothetical protein